LGSTTRTSSSSSRSTSERVECEVRLHGGASKAAGGVERAVVEVRGRTLGDLLDEVKRRWPGVGDFIDGSRSGSMFVVLNGRALECIDRSMGISSGDVVAIMPFVAGG